MSWAKRKPRSSNKWGGGRFNALPQQFTASTVLCSLSPHACKLFLDLQSQYHGFNNGDLCITWSVMKQRGWRSRTTLQSAKQDLLDVELIICTRPGGRRRCALYALTIYDIDACDGKHDVTPTSTPPRSWRAHEPPTPIAAQQATFKAKQAKPVATAKT
jgi:hypothetical protein